MKTRKGLKIPMDGECYACGAECTPEEFCEECEQFFCDSCNIYMEEDLESGHQPEDHSYSDDDDWEDYTQDWDDEIED